MLNSYRVIRTRLIFRVNCTRILVKGCARSDPNFWSACLQAAFAYSVHAGCLHVPADWDLEEDWHPVTTVMSDLTALTQSLQVLVSGQTAHSAPYPLQIIAKVLPLTWSVFLAGWPANPLDWSPITDGKLNKFLTQSKFVLSLLLRFAVISCKSRRRRKKRNRSSSSTSFTDPETSWSWNRCMKDRVVWKRNMASNAVSSFPVSQEILQLGNFAASGIIS